MKFIASLPKCFTPAGQNEKGLYLFTDNKSPLARVISPISHPASHQKEWAIALREYRNKNDGSEYPVKIVLKLFEIDETNQDLPRVRIEREIIKGAFASTNRPTIYFAAIPLDRFFWLTYSIFSQSS